MIEYLRRQEDQARTPLGMCYKKTKYPVTCLDGRERGKVFAN